MAGGVVEIFFKGGWKGLCVGYGRWVGGLSGGLMRDGVGWIGVGVSIC